MSANPFAAPARTAAVSTASADDFLDGGASVAAKWPKEGFTVKGSVVGWSPVPFQQTDMKSGEPLFWEGKKKTKESDLKFEVSRSNPCMQITVDLQCEPTGVTWETNRYVRKEVPDDDGIRTVYVHGMLAKAISKARKQAAQQHKLGRASAPLEVGALVEITRGDDVKMANDMYGYTYSATWTPAASNPDHTDALAAAAEDPWSDNPTTAAAQEEEPPF